MVDDIMITYVGSCQDMLCSTYMYLSTVCIDQHCCTRCVDESRAFLLRRINMPAVRPIH